VALRDALGDDWAAIVAIDTHAPPIGSGCIAQVYRGTLRATGERVAVKVIHPQVKELVAFDLELMRLAVRAMEAVPRLQLLGGRESVDEFAAIMGRQLDLRAEAENLLRFKRHFRGRRGALGFPTPHLEHTTESVLVESFEDGMHFSEMCAQLDAPRRKAAARVLLESFLRMVFLDNFAHGDLHPGNLLFAAAPQCDVQDQVPRHTNALLSLFGEARQEHKHEAAPVVAVDAGIVTRLEPEDLRNFVELFHAVATGDGHKAGELIVARSKPTRPIAPAGEKQRLDTPADGAKMAVSEQMTAKCTDVEAFCAGMEAIVNEALRWRLSLRKVHVGALLREVMELCCAHEVKLEGKYASIVVSIAVLEAVGRKLDPDIDLLAVAMPIIAQSLVQNVLTA
jgi:aarF domain-containing kinase